MGKATATKGRRWFLALDVIGVGCIVFAQILFMAGSTVLFLNAGVAGIIVGSVMMVLSLGITFLIWETWGDLLRYRWSQRK
jgi:nicotinamide riboside transporter PnuC